MISIFNGRSRSLTGTVNEVWAKFDVSLRSHICDFKQGTNLNPWAVFTVLALHANEDGWSFPSTELLKEETGLSTDEAISSALNHLRSMTIDGKRILEHYRVKRPNGQWGKSYYRIFPDADEAKPPVDDLILWNPNPTPPPGMPGVDTAGMEMPGVSLSRTNLKEEPNTNTNAFANVANAPSHEPVNEPSKSTIANNAPVEPLATPSKESLEKTSPPVAPPPSPKKQAKAPVPRSVWHDLTDAMHGAIPDSIRPPGKPHYGKNNTPAKNVFDAGLTVQDVTEYVSWAYQHDKWYCCGGAGGSPILMSMYDVQKHIKAWKATKGVNGNGSPEGITGIPATQQSGLRGSGGNSSGTYSPEGSSGAARHIPSIIPRVPGVPRPAGLRDLSGDGSSNAGR